MNNQKPISFKSKNDINREKTEWRQHEGQQREIIFPLVYIPGHWERTALSTAKATPAQRQRIKQKHLHQFPRGFHSYSF